MRFLTILILAICASCTIYAPPPVYRGETRNSVFARCGEPQVVDVTVRQNKTIEKYTWWYYDVLDCFPEYGKRTVVFVNGMAVEIRDQYEEWGWPCKIVLATEPCPPFFSPATHTTITQEVPLRQLK